jgi:hypothetical protein
MASVIDLRRLEFDARQRAMELRRTVFDAGRHEAMPALVDAEQELQRVSNERASEEKKQGVDDGSVVAVPAAANLLGPETTGLEVKVDLRMSNVPTSIVHLFSAADQPLVSYDIRNTSGATKRLRLIAYVEGFSASAVDTIEVLDKDRVTRQQMPTFFGDRIASLTELNRATLNVEVQDLDAKTEVHKTMPLWLLARSTAPLQVKDPSSGTLNDLTAYLGAFVTPNAPAVMDYLRRAVDKHPSKSLVGYQLSPAKAAAGEKADKEEVLSQVKAVYEALAESKVVYINSTIDFTPEAGTANNQRVRVPRESLATRSANCIDGTVLMASLLEAISLNPGIVIVPGHAFLAWETWRNNNEWRYLETTMVGSDPFDAACQQGDQTAERWQALGQAAQNMFKRWSLRDLRAMGIMPLE